MEDRADAATAPNLVIRNFGAFRSGPAPRVREPPDRYDIHGAERWRRLGLTVLLLVGIIAAAPAASALASEPPGSEAFERDRIQPFAGNRHCWQYQGEPLLLIGGTHDDNPFR